MYFPRVCLHSADCVMNTQSRYADIEDPLETESSMMNSIMDKGSLHNIMEQLNFFHSSAVSV